MKMKYEKYDNKNMEYEKWRKYFAKHLRIAARNPLQNVQEVSKVAKIRGNCAYGVGRALTVDS